MANLKYDETFPVKVAEYAAKGDTDVRIAARLGIALSTFYTYKEQFPEFAEGLVAGRRICYSLVRAMLLKVARGQCKLTTRVYKNGELYKTTERNLPPNLKAIIYFQKNMRIGGRLSDLSCWPHGHKIENSPAQADSGISSLGASQTSQAGPTCPTEPQRTPVQADSGISSLGRLSGELCWPHGHKTENAPAQADSVISSLGASQTSQAGPTCPTEPQRTPVQADSGISSLGMGLICPIGPIGLMSQKPAMKTTPAQADSGNSILENSQNGPVRPV